MRRTAREKRNNEIARKNRRGGGENFGAQPCPAYARIRRKSERTAMTDCRAPLTCVKTPGATNSNGASYAVQELQALQLLENTLAPTSSNIEYQKNYNNLPPCARRT